MVDNLGVNGDSMIWHRLPPWARWYLLNWHFYMPEIAFVFWMAAVAVVATAVTQSVCGCL